MQRTPCPIVVPSAVPELLQGKSDRRRDLLELPRGPPSLDPPDCPAPPAPSTRARSIAGAIVFVGLRRLGDACSHRVVSCIAGDAPLRHRHPADQRARRLAQRRFPAQPRTGLEVGRLEVQHDLTEVGRVGEHDVPPADIPRETEDQLRIAAAGHILLHRC